MKMEKAYYIDLKCIIAISYDDGYKKAFTGT